jgi:hypothetical protein
MAGVLSHVFVDQKRQSMVALSASDVDFVMIRSIAGEDQSVYSQYES